MTAEELYDALSKHRSIGAKVIAALHYECGEGWGYNKAPTREEFVKTVRMDAVAEMTDSELRRIPNLGGKSLSILRAYIEGPSKPAADPVEIANKWLFRPRRLRAQEIRSLCQFVRAHGRR